MLSILRCCMCFAYFNHSWTEKSTLKKKRRRFNCSNLETRNDFYQSYLLNCLMYITILGFNLFPILLLIHPVFPRYLFPFLSPSICLQSLSAHSAQCVLTAVSKWGGGSKCIPLTSHPWLVLTTWSQINLQSWSRPYSSVLFLSSVWFDINSLIYCVRYLLCSLDYAVALGQILFHSAQ